MVWIIKYHWNTRIILIPLALWSRPVFTNHRRKNDEQRQKLRWLVSVCGGPLFVCPRQLQSLSFASSTYTRAIPIEQLFTSQLSPVTLWELNCCNITPSNTSITNTDFQYDIMYVRNGKTAKSTWLFSTNMQIFMLLNKKNRFLINWYCN